MIKRLAFSLLTIALCTTANAIIIPYGDFVGDDVMYLGVTEDTRMSPIALFGQPDVTGNKLDFDPTSFTASAGPNNPNMITDGQLNFTVMSNNASFPIEQVIIEEAGDFTLVGLGSALAEASVGTLVRFTVTALDGVPTAAVPAGSAMMMFTPEADGMFDLANNGGTAVPWAGMLNVDIAQYLVDNNISGNATKIEFSIDNTLTAVAADGGSAFIAKKDFNGVSITIPEPSSAIAAILGMLSLGFLRRK